MSIAAKTRGLRLRTSKYAYKKFEYNLSGGLMSISEDFEIIMEYAHFWNWLPDWNVVQEVYQEFPNSYSVLIPFAYAYLEELIRSTTSQYGIEIIDGSGEPQKRKVGIGLLILLLMKTKITIWNLFY